MSREREDNISKKKLDMTNWTIPELSIYCKKVWSENPNKTPKDVLSLSAILRELIRRGFEWEELDAILDKDYAMT